MHFCMFCLCFYLTIQSRIQEQLLYILALHCFVHELIAFLLVKSVQKFIFPILSACLAEQRQWSVYVIMYSGK